LAGNHYANSLWEERALGHETEDEHGVEALNNDTHVLIRPLHAQDWLSD
jgi:hypothetical protein